MVRNIGHYRDCYEQNNIVIFVHSSNKKRIMVRLTSKEEEALTIDELQELIRQIKNK